MRRSMLLSACVVLALAIVLFPAPVRASGAGTVSLTQTFQNAVMVMEVPPLPCAPGGLVTLTFNGVAHVTFLTAGVGAGTGWDTFTATGTFTLAATTGVTFTGMLTAWDGGNGNLNNFASTGILSIHATGSDGSTVAFHDAMHVTVLNPLSTSPTVVVSFDMPTCG